MDKENEDRKSRRKFLTGAGLAGAAAVVATPAVAKVTSAEDEFSPEQISKLEEIVRNFITNAKATNTEPLGSTLALMGHGSHNNENGATPKSRNAPASQMKKKGG
ncbi:MAG: twin-arginine translocation signal domain-containing protein [Bryobacteraceae bacterium]